MERLFFTINELTARAAKEANSMSGYVAGSATSEYQNNVLNGHHVPDIITICERKRWEDEFNDKYGN